MPIYEFLCKDCGKVFEEICFSRQEIESVRCPHCQSAKVSKLFAPFAQKRSPSKTGLGASCSLGGKSPFS